MTKRPNILWIYCDELRTDALSCYGHCPVELETPNLDRLASQGTLYHNCFTNSPLCVPARVAVLSGLYPEQSGVYANEGSWPEFKMARQVDTFPEMLFQAGYATADFGKMHIPQQMQPFSYRESAGAGMKEFSGPANERGVPIIRPAKVPMDLGGSFPEGVEFPAKQVTDNALSWIEKQRDPFMVRLSYLQPHTPVLPPQPYDKLYADKAFRRAFIQHDAAEIERRFAEVTGTDSFTAEDIFLIQQYYYGLVRWIDDEIGRLMQALEEMKLLDDLFIVFHADHGVSLGENGCVAKHTFTPQVHRVPLILKGPGVDRSHEVDGICQSIDLAPTILSLCQLKPSDEMKGRNLLEASAVESIFGTVGFGLPASKAYPNLKTGTWVNGSGWPRRSCVRTQEYRLDLNVRLDGSIPSEEHRDVFLSNWKKDPLETKNLAHDPTYQSIRSQLEAKVTEHIAGSLEPDGVPS